MHTAACARFEFKLRRSYDSGAPKLKPQLDRTRCSIDFTLSVSRTLELCFGLCRRISLCCCKLSWLGNVVLVALYQLVGAAAVVYLVAQYVHVLNSMKAGCDKPPTP